MPQPDLSSVYSGDRKVACETTAVDGENAPAPTENQPITVTHLDYAPESFWLAKEAEIDWLDRNAFIERKDSGKGSYNSVPNSTNLNPNSTSISGSQRHSVNLMSKASMIGLPKPQNPNYAESKHRKNCRPASIRLFPKRSASVSGKPATAMSEPSSPKVSCMGRVRSKKDRSRRGKNRKKQSEPSLVKSRSSKEKKTGFWTNFRSIFRSKPRKENEPDKEVAAVRKSSSSKKRRGGLKSNTGGGGGSGGLSEPAPVEAPGLGAVKRFTSGRKSDAWAAEIEVNDAKSEPLDRGPIWQRRESGPPVDIEVNRDWQSVGPSSV